MLCEYVAARKTWVIRFVNQPWIRLTGTVTSLCNDCFGAQENCPYLKLSLLRGAAAVYMQ